MGIGDFPYDNLSENDEKNSSSLLGLERMQQYQSALMSGLGGASIPFQSQKYIYQQKSAQRRQISFWRLNTHVSVDEGENLNAVDMLRLKAAQWLKS